MFDNLFDAIKDTLTGQTVVSNHGMKAWMGMLPISIFIKYQNAPKRKKSSIFAAAINMLFRL